MEKKSEGGYSRFVKDFDTFIKELAFKILVLSLVNRKFM